jgi:hypothetical protein
MEATTWANDQVELDVVSSQALPELGTLYGYHEEVQEK